MNPGTTVKTAAPVAAGTSNFLNKTISLFSHGYGDEDKPSVSYDVDQRSCKLDDQGNRLADQQCCRYADRCSRFSDRVSPMIHHKKKDEHSQAWSSLTDEYMNRKTGTLNKKGGDDLNDRYKIKEKFRDEIINFVGDKTR